RPGLPPPPTSISSPPGAPPGAPPAGGRPAGPRRRPRGAAPRPRARWRCSTGPTTRSRRPRPCSALVSRDVREDRQAPRALHGGAELALVPGAHPADAPREDLPALGDEAREAALVLVIDRPDSRFADRAALTSAGHGSVLPLVGVLVVVARLLDGRDGRLEI